MVGLFNKNADKLPSKPVIGSLAGAIGEIERWTKENSYHEVEDMDGLKWTLNVEMTQQPDIEDLKALVWEIKLQYRTEVSAELLVATTTLDGEKDARLVEIIGNDIIPLSMKPRLVMSKDEDDAKGQAAVQIPHMMKSLSTASLHDIKRKLLGRWVDQRCKFGGFDQ